MLVCNPLCVDDQRPAMANKQGTAKQARISGFKAISTVIDMGTSKPDIVHILRQQDYKRVMPPTGRNLYLHIDTPVSAMAV